jgi:hypothetical protein
VAYSERWSTWKEVSPKPLLNPRNPDRNEPIQGDRNRPISRGRFQTRIGIRNVDRGDGTAHDLEQNVGIYRRICNEERLTKNLFIVSEAVVISGLVVQAILSAIFIILGAIPGDHKISIAVLGAINGAIVTLLGIFKARGLPNRLRQYTDSLTYVKEKIERLERRVDDGEVEDLITLYDRIRQDAGRNHPDTWTVRATEPATS